MAYIELPYQLVNYPAVLKSCTFEVCDYDAAVAAIVQFYKEKVPAGKEEDIREQVHGHYFRMGLLDKAHRIDMVEQYVQQVDEEAYAKMNGLNYPTERGALLSNGLIELFLLQYPQLVPGINKTFFVPEPLPEIRSSLGGMQEFVDSVRHSIITKNWFGALFMALALPDICGVLTEGEGAQVGPRYRKWFDNYLRVKYNPDNEYESRLAYAHLFPLDTLTNTEIEALKQRPVRNANVLNFTARDCYGFRCKALHQGLAQRNDDPSSRIQFSPTQGSTIHRSFIDGKWWLSISVFCEDVCQAVEKWLADVQNDPVIQGRLAELMTIAVS